MDVGGVVTFVAAGNCIFLEMQRLLFGEAGCTISKLVIATVAKVLFLPATAYIDDFSSLYWLLDVHLPFQLWDFVHDVLQVALHEDKVHAGIQPLFLGMQMTVSPAGISLRLSPGRRSKYATLVDWYLEEEGMTKSQAAELAGRPNWTCNTLFGRCGCAFLAPILRRATNRDSRWAINGHMRRALGWCSVWLGSPEEYLVGFVPSAPRSPRRPAISYSDASTDFGLGGVLFLPEEALALWFATPCSPGDPIDLLEAKAVAVADAVISPIVHCLGYDEELAFVDSNVGLAWVTSGSAKGRDDAKDLLEGLWLQMALRQAFKWWERVSSASNVADIPSRGLCPEVPCTWRLREIEHVGRWDPAVDGLTPGRQAPC